MRRIVDHIIARWAHPKRSQTEKLSPENLSNVEWLRAFRFTARVKGNLFDTCFRLL
jgi:hypothetical protein